VPRAPSLNRDEAVAKIQQRVGELLGRAVAAQARLAELIFWGRPILSEQEHKDWKDRLGSLKTFLESLQPIEQESFQSRAQARNCTFEYIETFYNRTRRHSTLQYMSPVMYERMMC
jgi:nicotinic acid mononucleotide adenylyltransferase